MKPSLLVDFQFNFLNPVIKIHDSAYQNCFHWVLTYFALIITGLLLPLPSLFAQDELLGLTSVGGAQGAGTAFSIKSNGTNFTVQKTFAQSGNTPYGNLIKGPDGNFYGMTSQGGAYSGGTIFKMTPSGSVAILLSLRSAETGSNPQGSLLLAKDGNFYGMTYSGGTFGYGTIFKITPTGTFTLLRKLNGQIDGGNPQGSLVQGNDGSFYGMTSQAGLLKYGTIFKITANGAYTVIKNLDNTTGSYPQGSLVKASDGNFYGLTNQGGTNDYGTIFRVTPKGNFTVRRHLDNTISGGRPQGSLVQGSNGALYGLTYQGGANSYGTIFRMALNGTFTVLHSLNYNTDGGYAQGDLIQGTDGNFYGTTYQGGTNSAGTIFKITPGGSFTVLHNLDNINDGRYPQGGLVQGTGANYYGMTSSGGPGYQGTVFRITSTGSYSVLAHFPESGKGQEPHGNLIQARNGNFYGLTSSGGTYGYGTLFRMCNDSYSTLHSFNSSTSGRNPQGSLVQGIDGNFYGTTQDGGTSNYGTIFKITPGGTLTVLRNLSYATDGGNPMGSLIQSGSNFYGMTNFGGTENNGTIFRISPSGTYTVLKHLENSTTGGRPRGSLIKGSDGNFYGMTNQGGANNNGTIFKITPSGTLTVLRNLDNSSDGGYPSGDLAQGADGNFYGMTNRGGLFYNGTIFKITPGGVFTVIHHLDFYNDGGRPTGSLIQGSDGSFYGLTPEGGYFSGGTIFKITASGTLTVLRQLDQESDGGMPLGSLIIRKANPMANAQSITTVEETSKLITLTGSASGSPLIYSIVTPPQNGTISGGNGANRTYKPNANFAGKDSFTFKVIWGCQESAVKTVSITVTNVNDAPLLAAIGDKNATAGFPLQFTALATDPDAGQTKSFSLISAPAGASINNSSGKFSWTPPTAGSYTFKIRVTDNGTPALFDEEAITVTVAVGIVRLGSQAFKSNDLEINKSIELYPNPVITTVMVNLPEKISSLNTSINDSKGGKILVNKHQQVSPNQIQIKVQDLPAGLYLLHLQLNNKIETLKFIKQ